MKGGGRSLKLMNNSGKAELARSIKDVKDVSRPSGVMATTGTKRRLDDETLQHSENGAKKRRLAGVSATNSSLRVAKSKGSKDNPIDVDRPNSAAKEWNAIFSCRHRGEQSRPLKGKSTRADFWFEQTTHCIDVNAFDAEGNINPMKLATDLGVVGKDGRLTLSHPKVSVQLSLESFMPSDSNRSTEERAPRGLDFRERTKDR